MNTITTLLSVSALALMLSFTAGCKTNGDSMLLSSEAKSCCGSCGSCSGGEAKSCCGSCGGEAKAGGEKAKSCCGSCGGGAHTHSDGTTHSH
ncbi:hypothetical protein [Mucisphaera sp.]|uniref:hypothetical protein n=1 Tax=Mucisphaera sp. TaxID=2913024 RepID=UPI003D1236DC